MNYEELLKKYMKHVIDVEGWDFLQDLNSHATSVCFTEEEVTMLQTFSDEVSDE